MKTCVVEGKSIALANVDGAFFAVDDACTHSKCSLGSEGMMDGNAVVCGCHGAQFDVTTGKVMTLPATVDLKTYETKTEDGSVYVKLS